jgi:hypothetical protein
MRKTISYLIIYKSIFYLKFFEHEKIYFESLQIQISLKIQIK